MKCAWDRMDAIRKECGMTDGDAPASAFSTAEYASKYGVPLETARRELDRLVSGGRLKSAFVKRKIGGRRRAMRVYWIP